MLSLAKIGRGREDYHLLAVLAGRSPDGTVQLVALPRTGQRMPGIDACFKAPRSVSLLWAFGDRIGIDRVVQAAHDEVVEAALSYLESAASSGRRGYNGLVQVHTSGFVAAAFRQRTSRADDPHPRTHVSIANMCEGSVGRWGALDARLIYAHAKAAGYLYESQLRHCLSTDLGVDWAEVENGIADVAGVPEAQIIASDGAWSVNAAPIERERILRGWTPVHLARVAHVDPRTVRSLVANRRRPSLGTGQALCTVLGLHLADVIVFSRQ